ncbi:SDR family oxidoreductase [Streptomyces sp. NBC_00208]|uniref:SDR family NAD(P)-dependent oxidoreductase n=1 Tax=Streptomyces sp. NBC_00208 TaxID=2975681 RepID=UPI002E29407D|nr:SDR family oxidoreductase [Streptomyces sp. NBC_00208]
MPKALTGRTALVTGGSRGIGAEIARGLAREGASVAITYRKSREQAEEVVAELASLGAKAFALQADQSVPQEAATAVEQAAEQLGGRIDVLVNSAGVAVMGEVGQLDDLEGVQQMMATNVMGTIATTHSAARYLPDGGRVILVGSIVAHRVAAPGVAEYAASKAAIDQLGRGWARDFGPRGITVNVVQPGATDTDMNPADGPFAATQVAMTPLGRFGTTDDIAKAVVFLASENAAFITGALLTVDGGFSI